MFVHIVSHSFNHHIFFMDQRYIGQLNWNNWNYTHRTVSSKKMS